ncbi:MAG: hypothetical protein KY429_08945 [Actinobacteria bacterium]|nr:hypothetical protein [Actinomycetota bacterium]
MGDLNLTLAKAVLAGADAMARVLRESRLDIRTESLSEHDAVTRVLAKHPKLGRRQEEVIRILESKGEEGTNTGVIARAIGYDQPNVYLTLQHLIRLGFVRKDDSQSPHRYYLDWQLLDEEGEGGA